jgi:hypothetical protein
LTRTLILEVQFNSTFEKLLVALGASSFLAFNLAREITDKDPWALLFEERASLMFGEESALFSGVVQMIFTLLQELKEVLQTNNEVRPSNELRPSY